MCNKLSKSLQISAWDRVLDAIRTNARPQAQSSPNCPELEEERISWTVGRFSETEGCCCEIAPAPAERRVVRLQGQGSGRGEAGSGLESGIGVVRQEVAR